MNAFLWDKTFLTGLEDVDQQHHALVDLINRYSALLEEGGPVNLAQMERVCDELADYARYHFSEEQMFMDELELDARHIVHHVRQHADFFLDLAWMRNEVVSGRPDASRHLLEFLVHWLAAHILGTDQSMARQVTALSAGLSAREAYDQEERAQDPATATLIRSMTSLTMVVSERSRQLSELNHTLESRVLQRTRELSASNEQLTHAVQRLQAEQKETRRLTHALSEANRDLEARAMVDRLTGLPNLQYALNRLASEIASARHFGHPLTVALFAAEGFKEVNATFGPEAGDAILQAVGTLLRSCFRPHDVVCHVGVEAFLVICPRTPQAGTVALTDQVRAALPGLVVPVGSEAWQGRLSAGIAEFGPEADTVEKLVQVATTQRWELEPVTS